MRLLTLSSLLAFLCWSVGFAQTETEEQAPQHLKKGYEQQQMDYEQYNYPYPGKKKDKWVVGLDLGMPFILGDIAPSLRSFGAGIHVRKAVTPFLSFRYQSLFMQAKGFDGEPRTYRGERTYWNYRSRMTDHTIQGVITLNNFNFHKKDPKVTVNLFGGLGIATSFQQRNALDENGMAYDYASEIWNVDGGISEVWQAQRQHREMLDDGYETTVTEPMRGQARIKDTKIHPSFVFGAGIDFHLSKSINLNLNSRVSRHLTDQLDGWVAENDDWLMFNSIGLDFKIGKAAQPAYMSNPNNDLYEEVAGLRKQMDADEIFADDDADGVPNSVDLEPNTVAGAEVNAKGQALDSDKDGVADYMDSEPFSPKGAMVDERGVARDGDNDGVADIFDKEYNTPEGSLVDVKGREIKSTGGKSSSETLLSIEGVDVWTVFFDSDQHLVKNEYMPIIMNLASMLIANPEVNLQITGHTDDLADEEYNRELSRRRAESVLNEFVELGVDKTRFSIMYKGENEQLLTDDKVQTDYRRKMNRRVTLRVK